ncbi:alpha/beta fold hydrolase [Sciscionella marina]|uniref:alpha/beta fold hydrolase n=1 Tax=Sciscionella marina TaxID=508770 RepID=UPI0003A2B5A2|nr:alpha/beta hydrolase [Sciscionella marina]
MDGYGLNYERRGSGTPLVLLHGIGHRWQAWRPVLDELAAHHDVIAIDLPGFGRSPQFPGHGGYDVPGAMRRLRTTFDLLGVRAPHIAGNSLGGLLAVEAAAQGMVASATALSPAGFWTRRDRARALATLRMIRASARAPRPAVGALLATGPVRSQLLRVLHNHPERIDRSTALGDVAALRDAAGFAPTIEAGKRYSWQGKSPDIPVTIAWGAKDRVLPPRQAERAARRLPNARHVLLPDCGHVPMPDDPRLVARTILETCALAEERIAGVDETV